jgi:hypothetical protein
VIAGPAFAEAARPVIEKRPAPMMAPIPSATSPGAVNVFFNPFSESAASFKSWANGFLFQIDILFWFMVSKFQIYRFFLKDATQENPYFFKNAFLTITVIKIPIS